MKYIYEELEEGFMIKRTDENGEVAYVPVNSDNRDYQEYLASLENAE